jgi:class I fructose-bisphosphate aldolase
MMAVTPTTDVRSLLGAEADGLLKHESKTVSKSALHLPGPDFVDRVFSQSDRPVAVLRNFQTILNTGRLAGTGYVSILPVDQGVEHSAGASFAPEPAYFDPENIVKLALEGGCNAVASTIGVLGSVARKYAHKIPFLAKFNHNEMLTYPNIGKQSYFGSVRQCYEMGAVAVGATIYFGNDTAREEIAYVSDMFEEAHAFGMVTVLWCYTANSAFKVKGADGKSTDYHSSADLTGQANHLGATIKADIIKQKLPTNNGGYAALNAGGSSYGKWDKRVYTALAGSDEAGKGGHPIDLCRYQIPQQLHGPRAADQLRWREQGRGRPGRGRADGGGQQARRRHGADLRSQGVPEAAEGRREAAQRGAGCVSGQERDGGVSVT